MNSKEERFCPDNKPMLIELITKAMENYETWQKERENKDKRAEDKKWQVPEERYYPEIYKKMENIEKHALDPFYELQNVSSPEKAFAEIIENNKQYIDWWYKNGDKGREHFSIVYTNLAKKLSLFYIDFILHFKNGLIGFFDTKTKGSDPEAHNKHNALIEYIEKESKNRPGMKFTGGIVIPETTGNNVSFRYCRNRISDTKDLTGWDFFNPSQMQ